MVLIDFNSSAGEALKNGFLKGLGAPYLIFGSFQSPSIKQIPSVSPIVSTAHEAASHDWGMVKRSVSKAVNSYGEEVRPK